MQAETVLDLFAKRLAENATALAVVGEAEAPELRPSYSLEISGWATTCWCKASDPSS
jgi:hypothetical protein